MPEMTNLSVMHLESRNGLRRRIEKRLDPLLFRGGREYLMTRWESPQKPAEDVPVELGIEVVEKEKR